jgi:Zn-dependent protease/CBS domain-containing protein
MSPMPASRHAWSWSIGRLGGVDVRVHATFFLLLGWVLLSGVVSGHGLAATVASAAFVLVVFGVVVLHELGHATMARRFGIATRDITLLPIGGVARLERLPSDPKQELWIALAGPAVNVVLAGMIALALLVLRVPELRVDWLRDVLGQLLWLNVLMAGFNLLPAFPLDGGRVLRALLERRTSRVHATDLAARLGRWLAFALALFGMVASPMLVLVAAFVWIGGAAEAARVHVDAALFETRVGDAMVSRFETLSPHAPVAIGVEKVIRTQQRVFPVVDGRRLLGLVGAAALLQRAASGGADDPVATLYRPTADKVGPNDLLRGCFDRLEAVEDGVLPVLEHDELVGILSLDNVLQLAQLRDRVVSWYPSSLPVRS